MSTLGGRLALLASLLVILVAGVVGFALSRAAEADLMSAMERRGMAIARALAGRAAAPLAASDRASLELMLRGIWEEHDVAHVEVVDSEGRVQASRTLAETPAGAIRAAFAVTHQASSGARSLIGQVRVALDPLPVERRRLDYVRTAIRVSGIAALFGVVAATLMGLWLAAPLRRLRHAAEVTASGDYEQALEGVHVGGTEEVRALANTLEDAVRRISEREDELRSVNTELRETERARDAVTHMIVHDLKGPVANVLAVLGVLSKGLVEAEDRELVRALKQRCRDLLDRINDLLDVSRLEDGAMPMKRVEADAGEIALRAHASVEHLAREEGCRVDCDVPEEEIELTCDQDLMQRVVTNLLLNAMKHGASPISLNVKNNEHSVVFSVEDAGAGVPPEQVDLIFDKFHTGGGGTGLGLAFVKQAVEAHSGQVSVEGAHFAVEIPK